MDARTGMIAGGVLVVVVIVIIAVCLYYGCFKKENFEPFYLDQMAMKNPDPMYFKYMGYERDIAGMSGRDYYLENQTNAYNLAAPYYFEGDKSFVDHTDYLDMPEEYRPVEHGSVVSAVMKSEPKSDVEETILSENLVNIGAY